MDNIFTLHKYENEDSDYHLNIDDLYEKKREKDEELLKIFNCGIGYVLIISPEDYAKVIEDENNELTYLGKL